MSTNEFPSQPIKVPQISTEPPVKNERSGISNSEKLASNGPFDDAYDKYFKGIKEAAPWAQTEVVPEYMIKSLLSDWFQDYVKKNPGRQLTALDVGCGLGAIARALQHMPEFEFRVTGIDAVQVAIDEANKDSARLVGQTSPHYLVGNALDLEAALANSEDKQFDLIYEFSLIHHLDPESRKAYIKGVSDHLLPEGKFVITCFTDTNTVASVDETVEYEDGGIKKLAKFSKYGGKGVPTFLLSESEIREVAEGFFQIDNVEYIDVERVDKDGNKLPLAKRIKVLMTKK